MGSEMCIRDSRDTFRIGNIGEIYDADADRILELFAQYTKEFM